MSWYVEYTNGSKWERFEAERNVPGSGPYPTKADAQLALRKRSDWACASPSNYRVFEQRDTVPAGPEQGIPSADVNVMRDSKIAFAAKKVPLHMIPLKALYGVARVFAYGRKKHGAGNFLRACLSDGAGERYNGAELRHISETQNLDGTWDLKSLAATDDESGLPHIDHILATAIMLRAIMVKDGLLKLDPGEGNEPPKAAQ